MGRRSEIERFMSHVDKQSACWLWTAYRMPRGYGHFRQPNTHELAHRAAYRLFIGPIGDGLDVMHACDNPSCVNPAHLSLGTRTDNMRDAKRKGRNARGEAHGRSKLSAADVAAIRSSAASQSELARAFGVSQPHVSAIRACKKWAASTAEENRV